MQSIIWPGSYRIDMLDTLGYWNFQAQSLPISKNIFSFKNNSKAYTGFTYSSGKGLVCRGKREGWTVHLVNIAAVHTRFILAIAWYIWTSRAGAIGSHNSYERGLGCWFSHFSKLYIKSWWILCVMLITLLGYLCLLPLIHVTNFVAIPPSHGTLVKM